MSLLHLQGDMPLETWPRRQLTVLDTIAADVRDLVWRLYELDGVGDFDSTLMQRATTALDALYGESTPEAFAFEELRSIVAQFTHINELEAVGVESADALPLPADEEKYKAAQCVIHDYGVSLVDTRRRSVAEILISKLPFQIISEDPD